MSDPLVDHAVATPSRTEPFDEPLGALRARLTIGWITPTVGDVAVAYGLPRAVLDDRPEIRLTLLSMAPATLAVATRRSLPLQLQVRILVTASGPGADQKLVALGFAAVERGDPELERDEATVPWSELGVPLQLGF